MLAEAACDEVRAGRGLDAGWFDVLTRPTWVRINAAQLGECANSTYGVYTALLNQPPSEWSTMYRRRGGSMVLP